MAFGYCPDTDTRRNPAPGRYPSRMPIALYPVYLGPRFPLLDAGGTIRLRNFLQTKQDLRPDGGTHTSFARAVPCAGCASLAASCARTLNVRRLLVCTILQALTQRSYTSRTLVAAWLLFRAWTVGYAHYQCNIATHLCPTGPRTYPTPSLCRTPGVVPTSAGPTGLDAGHGQVDIPSHCHRCQTSQRQ